LSNSTCSTAYVDFVQRVGDRVEHLPAARLAALHRAGLRVYYATSPEPGENVEITGTELSKNN
jgi:hypothetical protein